MQEPDLPWLRELYLARIPREERDNWALNVSSAWHTCHMYPEQDVFRHDLTPECICGPDIELLEDHPSDCPDMWLYTHKLLAVLPP